MKTIIIWFRNDLRVHDHPALATAAAEADHVVPVFIFNEALINGKHASSNRNRFLLQSLEDLKASLIQAGADLVIRSGDAAAELQKLVKETSAEAIYYTADFTPFAITRDKAIKLALEKSDLAFRAFPGRLAVSSLQKLHTKAGTPHKVFTPFWKQWLDVQRREVAPMPTNLTFPKVALGNLPKIADITDRDKLSEAALQGGETVGRARLKTYLKNEIANYHQGSNDMAADNTSRLSSYLHFGCVSAREIENIAAE